jgi:hypothetical protein
MSQFGIFGEDLGEYGNMDAVPDMLGQDSGFSDLITSAPAALIGGSSSAPVPQNAPAPPGVLRKALPWLLGGLAIAAVATVVIYSRKAKANDGEEGDDDEGDDDGPNFAPKKLKANPGAPKKCPVGTEVQTLIFSADEFEEKEAVAWARKHKFSAAKVDETDSSFRIRQHQPSKYKSGSFRTITLTSGVKAVVGCPRRK